MLFATCEAGSEAKYDVIGGISAGKPKVCLWDFGLCLSVFFLCAFGRMWVTTDHTEKTELHRKNTKYTRSKTQVRTVYTPFASPQKKHEIHTKQNPGNGNKEHFQDELTRNTFVDTANVCKNFSAKISEPNPHRPPGSHC